MEANSSTDIGSFKFIANTLHTDLDTAVQYFIFALIAVFDPLAVTLILALNRLLEIQVAKKRSSDISYIKDILERVEVPIEKKIEVMEESVKPAEVTKVDEEEQTPPEQSEQKSARGKRTGSNNSIITN